MYNTCNLVYAQGMQIIDMLYRACMGNILELCNYSYTAKISGIQNIQSR